MRRVLIDPSILQFTQAIHDIGGGVINDKWIASAFTTAWDWIGGSVSSAPYGTGQIPTPLIVSWQWANGSVTVTFQRD